MKIKIDISLYLNQLISNILQKQKAFVLRILYNMGKKDDSKPAPPKKPLSAFFLFRGEVYDNVKAKNPDAKITELTKIISQMWGKVDEATKNRLDAEYVKNKAKYDQDKQAYERQHGKIERKKKKVSKKEK